MFKTRQKSSEYFNDGTMTTTTKTSGTIVVPLVHAYCIAGSWPFGWVYLADFENLDICCLIFDIDIYLSYST
jgi:hypothetical protein